MSKTFRKGDLQALIMESSKEFKAKLGTGVESGNKTNNEKAYSDAKKRAKDFDGGGKEEYWKGKAKFEKAEDGNYTTLDYEPENVSPEYKKRVKAQVKGYTSEAEMNNKIEKSGDFEDGEDIYNGLKKNGQHKHKMSKVDKKAGLRGHNLPDETFDKDEMYEGRQYPTAYFKRTTFITEGHMINKIPDEFKKEGKMFNMKDKTGNEYLLEWTDNHAVILNHKNKAGLDESIQHMKHLMGYKGEDSKTSHETRLNENQEKYQETLNKMRMILK